MTGETLAACIRRLRLETAANLLRFSSSLNITAVALACGFSSSQNFARVFREWMGMSPGTFRAACGQGTPARAARAKSASRETRAPMI